MLTASLERATEYNALFTGFINRAKSGESRLALSSIGYPAPFLTIVTWAMMDMAISAGVLD